MYVVKFKFYSNLKSILIFCLLCRKLNIVLVFFIIMMFLDISNKGIIYCIVLCLFISSVCVKEIRWLVFIKNIIKVIIYIMLSVFVIDVSCISEWLSMNKFLEGVGN